MAMLCQKRSNFLMKGLPDAAVQRTFAAALARSDDGSPARGGERPDSRPAKGREGPVHSSLAQPGADVQAAEGRGISPFPQLARTTHLGVRDAWRRALVVAAIRVGHARTPS